MIVHRFILVEGLANDVTGLEITAVATVSLMLGLVLGGLVAVFSRHAARGRLMLGDPRYEAFQPLKLPRGRHRPDRVPAGTQ